MRKQLELAQASAAEAQSRLAGMDSRLAGALAERDGLTGRMAQSQDVVDMAGASVASLENNLREQRAVLVQRERECQSLAARVGALEKANADLVSGLRKGAADAEATRRAADHARNALVLERDSARSQVAPTRQHPRLSHPSPATPSTSPMPVPNEPRWGRACALPRRGAR